MIIRVRLFRTLLHTTSNVFLFFLILICCVSEVTYSQVIQETISSEKSGNNSTGDYYESAYKLSGTALRSALHTIIKGHTVTSYDGLYTAFQSTDSKPDGKIWDIYSDIPDGTPKYEYSHGTLKCGNYSKEGDCYNREHSWCDSWLGATNPARSDLFHMYPTDGYVNNRRSNYPYGTVSSATWTSSNGSKVGTCTFPGYSGIAFEPINEYKGDIARSAMYMSVRYYTEDGGWATSEGTNKSDLLPWYASLLYTWHIADTVSTKEINRNNAIFVIQKNRNPFIDHPEFTAEIWQTTMPPSVVSAVNTNFTTTIVDFSRYLDSASAVNTANYVFDKGVGAPLQIIWGMNNDVSKLQIITAKLLQGTQYSLQLKNLKSINSVAMKDTTISFRTSGTAGIEKKSESIPSLLLLEQNFPNPFNPTTNIEFSIPTNGHTTLKVFDLLGREVAALVNDYQTAGTYRYQFEASHYNISSGVYYYQLRSGELVQTKKMIVTK